MSAVRHPQIVASDPEVSAFVTANAGSGKTSTLVDRAARLLLRGARPEAILCVTFTKAAAAEMQRRLFDRLGKWAVMGDDAELAGELAKIEEHAGDLSRARALFARALETPGGLKIQTIHALCEKLLRRFPLEAGVSPGFQVLEDQAAAEVSAKARDEVAQVALERPDGAIGRAYAHFAVELDHRGFGDMFTAFEARRTAIAAYVASIGGHANLAGDVLRRCGFDAPVGVIELEAEAIAATDWAALRDAGVALLQGTEKSDQPLGARFAALAEAALSGDPPAFAALWALFSTQEGKPKASMATKSVSQPARDWLADQQARLAEAMARIRSARVAGDTIAALTLAEAYAALYEAAKQARGGLDFADLITRTGALLTEDEGAAAWVLYKLDAGVEHVLVDEAQDTAREQWNIVRALTQEFFAGAGAARTGRTVFAVGDEKQSIFSFQGAQPERFGEERADYRRLVGEAGHVFEEPSLTQSWRSTPEVLAFVDAVFEDPAARAAVRPDAPDDVIQHVATRPPGCGAVDLWLPETSDPSPESDPWEPVDIEPAESGNKRLARRIAREIKAMVDRGEAVFDRGEAPRPLDYGDVLILVRRRGALFQEIIRALKRAEVPVGGADRLTLSDHVVFQDMIGLARLCLYPWDDLTLAALLRSPLCNVDEDSLYDLAQPREKRSLWAELGNRAGERPEWAAAHALFTWARSESRLRTPFDFFSRLLNRIEGSGSIRARILTRLGHEAEQAIDAFLSETLKAERRGARDLETFAADMAGNAVEVKREQDEGKGEVRVMTVHGAKGLEAPVVFLPDTATKAVARGGPLLEHDGGFLWCARKADDAAVSGLARQDRTDAGDRESLRLLYVALTRARDRLIVGAVTPGRASAYDGSWRDFIDRAAQRLGATGLTREIQTEFGPVIRHGADPRLIGPAVRPADLAQPLPSWASSPAPPDAAQLRYASPSNVADAHKGPSASPLAATGGLGRFRRGDLIHRLLQVLPDLEPSRRPDAALSLLAREQDLTPEQRAEMVAAAMGVLNDPQFAAVFGPGARAEVGLAGQAPGLPEGLAISGRIDRLLVEPDRILVVDYKTNRPSPDRIEDADPAYITQMAVYAQVLKAVFPGRRIEAALVWTDGPKLMMTPENLMARALEALPRSG